MKERRKKVWNDMAKSTKNSQYGEHTNRSDGIMRN
jgi:hypothetical protein